MRNDRETKKKEMGKDGQKRGYRERKIETATQKRQKEMERTRERKKGRETTDKTGNVSYISFFCIFNEMKERWIE